jgi:hypothetical protein
MCLKAVEDALRKEGLSCLGINLHIQKYQKTLSRVAGVAAFGVNTDYSIAVWALPFLLFLL